MRVSTYKVAIAPYKMPYKVRVIALQAADKQSFIGDEIKLQIPGKFCYIPHPNYAQQTNNQGALI